MADFIAGYISGAIGILVGNPLDVLKTRLQASTPSPSPSPSFNTTTTTTTLPAQTRITTTAAVLPRLSYRDAFRGIAAPVVTYGALNAVLFATYNRSLAVLNSGRAQGHGVGVQEQEQMYTPYWTYFAAGCAAGLATFVISAPTEVVKCRAQVVREGAPGGAFTTPASLTAVRSTSSLEVARSLWRNTGLKGFYHGGTVTALRDSIGYGFYYLSYEMAKEGWDRVFAPSNPEIGDVKGTGDGGAGMNAKKILLCGGLAGVVTWTSVFPLDVVKTRVQTQDLVLLQQQHPTGRTEASSLLDNMPKERRPLGAWSVATQAYRNEGIGVFFRGLGICCARAFVVNAVQWAVYEWAMAAMMAKD